MHTINSGFSKFFFAAALLSVLYQGAFSGDFILESVSSVTSAETVGASISRHLNDVQDEVVIVTDQITNGDFLRNLRAIKERTPGLMLKIVTGSEDAVLDDHVHMGLFDQMTRGIRAPHGKMHNKFSLAGTSVVITGSPNVTFPAYGNRNIESLVAISSAGLHNAYTAYHTYMIDPGAAGRLDQCRAAFAADIGNFRARVAPIYPIKDFIRAEFDQENITSIKISMFLISRCQPNAYDIVQNLKTLADRDVKIKIKVDRGRFQAHQWMRDALEIFRDYDRDDVAVETVTVEKTHNRPINLGILHDKLILIQKENPPSMDVIIGSAGFSEHVQHNRNYENMVKIHDDFTYEFFNTHFESIIDGRPFTANPDATISVASAF